MSEQRQQILASVQQMFVDERGRVQQMFVDERGRVQQMFVDEREHTKEFLRDAQMEILRGFEPFLKQVSIRFRSSDVRLSNAAAEMAARMEILENRLSEIEKRLLLDPQAA